jgi:hypothetical protein
MKTHSWKYSDNHRVKWRLDVNMTGETTQAMDAVDHFWHYDLINEDLGRAVISGEIIGQYEMIPFLTEFLADIQFQTTALLLGMAKYAK